MTYGELGRALQMREMRDTSGISASAAAKPAATNGRRAHTAQSPPPTPPAAETAGNRRERYPTGGEDTPGRGRQVRKPAGVRSLWPVPLDSLPGTRIGRHLCANSLQPRLS
jgi:hypothetical protein